MDLVDDGNNDDIFVYMGGDQEVPRNVTHVRVHKSVKIIRREAFLNCTNLVSIEMHDGVEIIEVLGFYYCTFIRTINLAGVWVIGEDAFQNCKALEDVEFGDKLERIEEWAFGRTALRSVKLPKVRVVGAHAFYGCEQLTDVELSEDLERIELEAFGGCPRLRRIVIPLKDNLLSGGLFDECGNLSQVDLVGGIHETIASLLLERWRNEMKDEIDLINQMLPNIPTNEQTVIIQRWMERVIRRIGHYKSEHYILLKEAMTLLELALWKANLGDNFDYNSAAREGVRVTRGQRKRARKDRCITSGESIVIKNVLPFLELE